MLTRSALCEVCIGTYQVKMHVSAGVNISAIRRGQAQGLYGATAKLSGRRHVPPIFTGCPVVSRQPGITSSQQQAQTSYDRDNFAIAILFSCSHNDKHERHKYFFF